MGNNAQLSESLELVAPSEADEAAVLDYKAEHLRHGETLLHGGALLDRMDSYTAWLRLVRGNTRRETVHPGWVPADTLLAIRRSDRKMVGIIDIRRELNGFLRNCGGHIGYGVRPSERRKGYATQMLRLALTHCLQLGLTGILISCHQDNIASRRTIEACGGKKVRDFLYETIPAYMFRIELVDIEALAERNQARAREVIADSGVVAAWEAIGATVNPVGSLPTGLLMTHRDVDFHIYTETLDIDESFKAMNRICRHPGLKQMEFRNLATTEECCFEWHVRMADRDGDEWQIDMIQILKGSAFDGYFERVADRIRAVLTPETRRAILELKYATPESEKIMGIEYYHAVIGDGVRDWPEFVAWRQAHPVTGIVEWCP